ncbi:DNA-binding response regulator [Streptomyces zagrosensis]|uniref:DNA-binding NarL/FixJ family response regulator n=1 Tax=Streptomyces zagrosensis TaxID=1042984 RepID=A0A7W9Q5H4_9ACTN|nr:DNA-binding response regulator [Streptomyces zagrosensis]MBB5933998.1 DNA-binding NarL/FixJ family response regulator [Streptomyces zagrosensis]
MDDQRVAVTVHGTDPLSRAGIIDHLRGQPGVELLDRPRKETATPPGSTAVAVLLAGRFDELAGAELRRLVRGGQRRVVVIADELPENDLMTVLEYGVRAVLWRHQATRKRLLRAVQRTARDGGVLPPDRIRTLLARGERSRRECLRADCARREQP